MAVKSGSGTPGSSIALIIAVGARVMKFGCEHRLLSYCRPMSRTAFKRHPERGSHDRALVHEIVDAAPICHFGIIRDGQPVVLPTIHGREGETIYIHGSKAAGNLRDLEGGIDVCVTVTLVDGIKAARSLFEHSMQYRSAVIFGKGRLVTDPEEREVALRAITEHVLPGRWDDARQPNRPEDRQTGIIAVEIIEASAKINTGYPNDEPEDLDLDVWAGVIPMSISYGTPDPAPNLRDGIQVPDYIRRLVE